MFEKSVITILKGFSAVIYVLIMLTLFSIPVLFIWQAVTPPVFTLNAVEITENAVLPEEAVSDRKENEAEEGTEKENTENSAAEADEITSSETKEIDPETKETALESEETVSETKVPASESEKPATESEENASQSTESSFGDDALAEDAATDEESWTRIDFFLTAEAGKISPYSYMIDCFVAEENELLKDKEYELILDEPISFDNKTGDDFTLSLYIKEDIDIEKLCQTISFKAEDYEKSFAEFSLKW
ncbi:MAG: hypothetical protein IJO68_04090 [Clostridia bacterium]|nr:hypothetical protein [Clostridia bacterium]